MHVEFSFFTLKNEQIIHESMDDEVVIVNLSNGHYYNLSGLSAEIWSLLLDGQSYSDLVSILEESFSKERDWLAKDLHQFIESLLGEDILVEANNLQENIQQKQQKFSDSEYVKPELEIFTDIEDLLLLDPIHDVDKTGWPFAKQADN